MRVVYVTAGPFPLSTHYITILKGQHLIVDDLPIPFLLHPFTSPFPIVCRLCLSIYLAYELALIHTQYLMPLTFLFSSQTYPRPFL